MATVLQIPVGVWVFTALPRASRDALFGGSLLAMAAFVAGLMLTLRLIQQLVLIAMGEVDRTQLQRATVTLLAVVLLMTAGLRLSREAEVQLPHAAGETQGNVVTKSEASQVSAGRGPRNRSGRYASGFLSTSSGSFLASSMDGPGSLPESRSSL